MEFFVYNEANKERIVFNVKPRMFSLNREGDKESGEKEVKQKGKKKKD